MIVSRLAIRHAGGGATYLDGGTQEGPSSIRTVAVVHEHTHEDQGLEVLQRMGADKITCPLCLAAMLVSPAAGLDATHRTSGVVPNVTERLYFVGREVFLRLRRVHKVEAKLESFVSGVQ